MAQRTRGGVAAMSVTELQKELRRRSRRLPALERRRDRLMSKVAALDEMISALGGATGGQFGRGPRKRPHNDLTLVDALAKLLKGRTMSVTEAAEAVQKAGYKTSSSTFRTIVNQTLLKGDTFKKVSRGKYTTA
jgi:hypothetical protein